MHETELDTREIINNINGVFLTEQPDVFNINGGHKYPLSNLRVRVDLFKGFSGMQRRNVFELQEQQRAENRASKDRKNQAESEWAMGEVANRRAVELLERAKQRQSKELAIAIRKENEAKAAEDKKRHSYIDKVLYTNPPEDSYFKQFNTTSR